MTHAQTSSIIISGNLSEEDQVTTFDALRKITWSSEGIAEDTQENHPPEPFEDVKRVQKYLDANHITATAAYVPTTVWDLYFIYKCFKDQDFQERCYLTRKKSNGKEFPKIYFQVSQELLNRMHTYQKRSSQKDLAFFARFGETILELIATEISVERLLGESEWIKALICGYEKTKNNKGSLILEMIRQEYQAAQKNQILLVRATNGLPLQSKASTEQEFRDQVRKNCTRRFKDDLGICSPELEEKVEEKVNELVEKYYRVKWFQSFNHDQRALDFPLTSSDEFGGHSAYQGIDEFKSGLLNSGELYHVHGKDLSYASSLLAGYFYDGFDIDISACSFVLYARDPKLTLYTLSLDKKWFFTGGASFFHVGGLPLEGILGQGESFHPRLRSINCLSTLMKDHTYNVSSIRRFEPDQSFDWSGFNEKIQRNPEKKKIFQYALKSNEILSSASILSLGGKLTSRDRFAKEKAKKIIENQKRCSEVLIEKCKEIEEIH